MASPLQPSDDEFELLGAARTPFADAYHLYLRAPLWLSISLIISAFIAANLAFALLYWLTGGIANSDGSFTDAFFFSVQTMATIGYGAMYPATPLAHALVTTEAVAGLLTTAISTGLIFAKIALPAARITFTDNVCIGVMDGVPTVLLRVGNQRSNMVIDARVRMVLSRTETTKEGQTFYRMYDLTLVRPHALTLSRSWTLMHRITPDSPLWGATPDTLAAFESELTVMVTGIDDTTLQPVHAGARYTDEEVRFNCRPADILSIQPNGKIRLDLSKFHQLAPTPPITWADTDAAPDTYKPAEPHPDGPIRQGDLFWATVPRTPGEPATPHPHLILQPDALNDSRLDTVTVCALTSNPHRANEPGNILLAAGEAGLPRASVIVVSQVSTIQKSQLTERIGHLGQARVEEVLSGLRFQQANARR